MKIRFGFYAPMDASGKFRTAALALALLGGTLFSRDAWAGPGHGGAGFVAGGHVHAGHRHAGRSHGHVGLYFGMSPYYGGYGPGWYGAPWGDYPWAYPWTYPYGRAVIVRPPPPMVYVERAAPQAQWSQWSQWSQWYYCADPSGYYPYVKQCAISWRSVPAQVPVR